MKRKQKIALVLVVIGVALVLLIAAILAFKQPPIGRYVTWAAMAGDLNLLMRYEAKGASLDYQESKELKWTPLMAAISFQKTNIIQYLLSRNVNLNLQDVRGETALMMAIEMDDTNLVNLLLEKGADVTIKTKYGDAFMCANVLNGPAHEHQRLYLEWLNEYNNKSKTR